MDLEGIQTFSLKQETSLEITLLQIYGDLTAFQRSKLHLTGRLRSKVLSLSTVKTHVSCTRKLSSQGGKGELEYQHLG